ADAVVALRRGDGRTNLSDQLERQRVLLAVVAVQHHHRPASNDRQCICHGATVPTGVGAAEAGSIAAVSGP
ncbi:hypothetical protein, partial [Ilumatobacter sp.]|uniref:hypothetical protein n=1 Tax=Ilumatobacter sp. TaxID=1967498 RepID=UPI003AF931A4